MSLITFLLSNRQPRAQRRGRDIRIATLIVMWLSIPPLFGATDPPLGVTCEVHMVPMRDGIRLYTEVYRPTADGARAVVVTRSPYAGTVGDGCFKGIFSKSPAALAANGLVAVLQQVRGTARSEGQFNPFVNEPSDGYDTIEWAAKQSWSNGRVATTGASYLGAVQWQAAMTQPPHLVAIAPSITSSDYRDDWVDRNGVYDLEFNRWWGLSFVPDELTRRLGREGKSKDDIREAIASWNAQAGQSHFWIDTLPLSGAWGDVVIEDTPWSVRELAPFNWQWYGHPEYDSFWQSIDPARHIDKITVPAHISGGWYDLFAEGTIDSYQQMKSRAGTDAARKNTSLAMDCCGHALRSQAFPGQINWGPDRLDPHLTESFLIHQLGGSDNGFEQLSPVQLTILVPPDRGMQGDNFILYADDYPIPRSVRIRYYLGSNGYANTRLGDGVLAKKLPKGSPLDTFVYDPLHPVPSVGGVDAGGRGGAAAVDQSVVELRHDVLVYSSELLTQTVLVVGPVDLHFWARSTARDTDFTAKLVDVHPDGFAHNVVDRIVRARYRAGTRTAAALLEPGRIYEFHLRVGHTATEFRPGHRIRLELSSSNFPHYARNLNTGASNEDSAQTVSAKQAIFHAPQYPSNLELTVVALSDSCIQRAHDSKLTACRPQ